MIDTQGTDPVRERSGPKPVGIVSRHFSMTDVTYNALQQAARAEGLPVSTLVHRICREWLAEGRGK